MLDKLLEAMVLEGRHDAALQEVERCYCQGCPEPERPGWAAVWACRAAVSLGRWATAVLWAERGLAATGLKPEAEGILRLCLAQGLITLGDLLRAERELQAFLPLADTAPGLQPYAGDGHHSLGHLRRMLHRPQAATASFMHAVAAYERTGQPTRALQSWFEVAWSLLLEGRAEAARPALATVAEALSEYPDPELEIDLAIAVALYHSLEGECSESDRICQALAETSTLPCRQAADIAWVLGHNAMAAGNIAAAGLYLDAAYHAAVEEWSPCQLARISQLRERVARGPC